MITKKYQKGYPIGSEVKPEDSIVSIQIGELQFMARNKPVVSDQNTYHGCDGFLMSVHS
jgi:hypothetical protein